jgi:hypothetical protein
MATLSFEAISLLDMIKEQKQGTYSFLEDAGLSEAMGGGVGLEGARRGGRARKGSAENKDLVCLQFIIYDVCLYVYIFS